MKTKACGFFFFISVSFLGAYSEKSFAAGGHPLEYPPETYLPKVPVPDAEKFCQYSPSSRHRHPERLLNEWLKKPGNPKKKLRQFCKYYVTTGVHGDGPPGSPAHIADVNGSGTPGRQVCDVVKLSEGLYQIVLGLESSRIEVKPLREGKGHYVSSFPAFCVGS